MTERKRRKRLSPSAVGWIYTIVGGLLVLALVTAAAIVIVRFLGESTGQSTDERLPEQVVEQFDRAYQSKDCDLFVAATSDAFRDQMFEEPFSCERWLESVEYYYSSGEYAYEMEIVSVEQTSGIATIITHETDSVAPGEPVERDFIYVLIVEDGLWVVNELVEEGQAEHGH